MVTPNPFAPTPANTWSPSTLAVHADDHHAATADISPPIHVSTTFDYGHGAAQPSDLVPVNDLPAGERPSSYIYSRAFAPTSTRFEALLTALLGAPSLSYSSGLAALFAAYTLLQPRRVAISGGYHGAHTVLALHKRMQRDQLEILPLDCSPDQLQRGDVIHVETPLNPTGEARDIAHYASIAKARGAVVVVDATFAPPPLQDPFALGADIVMHSGTKYLGGHSDMLCGVLATRNKEWFSTLWLDRISLGSVMGSLEAWLGVRSVRTLQLRIQAQSRSAELLVSWLHGCLTEKTGGGSGEETVKQEPANGTITHTIDAKTAATVRKTVVKVQHASLQAAAAAAAAAAPSSSTSSADPTPGKQNWIRAQMPGGYGPVFALAVKDEATARALPSRLRLFQHATSLGGIESLVEWRAMSDPTVDRTLLRFSVGVEDWGDLREDLLQALDGFA